GVALGDAGESVAALRVVELFVVRLALQVEVEQCAAATHVRALKGQHAVEATGPQQSGVERLGAVGRGDDENVRVRRRLLLHLAVERKQQVDAVGELADEL